MESQSCTLEKVESESDWSVVHALRESELFSRLSGITYDRKHPTDQDRNNTTYSLRCGDEIVATARLDRLNAESMAIRHVVVKKEQQRKGFGTLMLGLLDNVTRTMGIRHLYVNAHPSAISFYSKNGYTPEQWDNPSPNIVADHVQMAKHLT